MIVTQTGMGTEIGHIADMLANTESEKTPLQKQLDGLSKVIASIAGVALAIVVGLGLLNGDSFDDLFVVGVTLAVAAISHRAARGRHRAALDRDPRDRAAQRDRQEAPRRRDAGFDVGDLLGQDRDADPEQDDRPRAGGYPDRTGSR